MSELTTYHLIQDIYENNLDDLLIPENVQAHIVDVVHGQEWKKKIIIEEGAELTYLLVCEDSSLDVSIINHGDNSQATIFCLFVGSQDSVTKSTITGALRASHTTSDMYLLSLLWNHSNIHVDGSVDIGPSIIKASGHLMEENLILGEKIKIKTLPMLDVRSNDVSASHGCKIDKVDAHKLFYMTSRWIKQTDANKLIVEWYVTNILEHFKKIDEETIKQLQTMIVQKVV